MVKKFHINTVLLFIFPLRIMDTFFSAAYHPIGVFLDESIQSYSSNTVQLSLALALGIKYNKVWWYVIVYCLVNDIIKLRDYIFLIMKEKFSILLS